MNAPQTASPICVSAMARYSGHVFMSVSCVPAPVTLPFSSTRMRSQFFTELTRCATTMRVVPAYSRCNALRSAASVA